MYHIFSKPECVYCRRAIRLLDGRGLIYSETKFDTPEKQAAFKASGHKTYPVIFKDDQLLGGYTELEASLM